ncbi:MAG TPA: M14 family metallopeptidase [Gaiellaceae bacterium]|nr:M14 family metallopeptidase [Gaiellaceae bacterium]
MGLVLTTALGAAGSAAAADERGVDPNQGDSLVEIFVPSKAAAVRLQAEAGEYGVEFNEHYLRKNRSGSYTVTVFASEAELDALAAAGYEVGPTIEGPATWRERIAERQADIRAENRADAAALGDPITVTSHENELVILRADYFENYAGRFISVEAKTRLGGIQADGTGYEGPTLSLSWNTGAGTPIDSIPRTMNINVDPDTTPDTYVEHRELVRVADGQRPTRIRIGSSTGSLIEGDVAPWLGPGLPPMSLSFKDFTTRYMDPTEVYARFSALAAEFPNIAQLIPLPHKTNGYQRKAQATLAPIGTFLTVAAPAGATDVRVSSTAGLTPGTVLVIGPAANRETRTVQATLGNPQFPNPNLRLSAPLSAAHPVGDQLIRPGTQAASDSGAVGPQSAVVVTSRAWGHEGGNNLAIELRDPAAANTPLSVVLAGNDIIVTLATDAGGAITSTALDVINAINANAQTSPLVVATRFRGSDGQGIAIARARVSLSDFLTTGTNAHVQRGPFQYSVMRIGKVRDGSKVGVFLYCQQHAREWATPLTCLETAERLLRNYAVDPLTRDLVDNLDIFILPSSNPDGSHYSIHNFTQQRRNMTNWCVEGGEETDDPMAPNFWQPRINPETGLPYANEDPGSKNLWGVDLNRNNTFGTIFDFVNGMNYIGASHSCTSDVYTGPAEASEPEIKNELWIADTFPNIKFSNNIHSFGGYFMWAPGTYLRDRSEGAADHANIGVEKYFFEAGDRILRRIEEHRDTVILPERTGPIADVLYSAAGNSADEHWYNRGVIAYSFETGADRFVDTSLSVASAAGATGIRLANRTGFQPGDQIKIDTGAAQEVRTVEFVTPTNPPSPAPNVILTAPLSQAHAAGAVVSGGITQVGVGFQPDYATEGKHEALEFANGNYGLLESALAYARDTTPPQVDMTGPRASRTPIETTFRFVNEPSVIRYTTNGSEPTASSPVWDSTGPREPGQTFHISSTTTFRWLATDIKGNTSTGSARFAIDATPPTSSASARVLPSGFANVTIDADDNVAGGGAGVAEVRYRLSRNGTWGSWQTYSGMFSVVGVGSYTLEYYAIDLAGNAEAPKTLTFEVTTAARALASCRITVTPSRVRAGQRTRVTARVTARRVEVVGAIVRFRGPGFNRSVRTNDAGVARVRVRPARRGTLRVRVAANPSSLACRASRRVLAPRRGAKVAGAAGSGGAALTS